MKHQSILIIDFGGQYSQLIARRVRENNVYCEVVPYTKAMAAINENKPEGIILSGGSASAFEEGAPNIDVSIYSMGIPILGISYGAQLMALAHGGKVEKQKAKNHQAEAADVDAAGGLVRKVVEKGLAWISHADQITELPEGFVSTATSGKCLYAAMENSGKMLFAVQFHPEIEQTVFGKAFLREFLFGICGCTGD